MANCPWHNAIQLKLTLLSLYFMLYFTFSWQIRTFLTSFLIRSSIQIRTVSWQGILWFAFPGTTVLWRQNSARYEVLLDYVFLLWKISIFRIIDNRKRETQHFCQDIVLTNFLLSTFENYQQVAVVMYSLSQDYRVFKLCIHGTV